MLSDVSSEAVAIYEKYAEEQITMITDEQATHMIAQLQEWARAKWGEPTYRYTVTHKQWDRRARSYMSRSKDCTFEEWRDNHKETDELYTRVIVGKYKPQWFAVYSRDIQKDGWPVELAKLVMGEATL
jgi:hypothetical protein